MNVSLTPKLEELVKEKVATGLYNNASEVVREALRLMEARDRQDLMRQGTRSTNPAKNAASVSAK
ncbi:type II toxin-antitoxin system ParD family antitoxin [Burkholderia gladioli]|uniref:type II toxin-antitoxin system ParD family antitoxin n=1 Tax=Burkholderia gladioli TaxID=28095 RepID=UPI00163EC6A2|nr:type II toxin-antitoxin system ParD family antitoxin [Burkholderia gladioli]MBU9174045.1 type II toxin-antitoxin system ParD family antitoxin [Burkholderia gladioli]